MSDCNCIIVTMFLNEFFLWVHRICLFMNVSIYSSIFLFFLYSRVSYVSVFKMRQKRWKLVLKSRNLCVWEGTTQIHMWATAPPSSTSRTQIAQNLPVSGIQYTVCNKTSKARNSVYSGYMYIKLLYSRQYSEFKYEDQYRNCVCRTPKSTFRDMIRN